VSVAFTPLGAGRWGGMLTYLGWLIARHGGDVARAIGPYVHRTLLYYVLPGALVIVAVYAWWRRRGSRTT